MGRRTRTGVFFALLVSAFAAAAVHAASPEAYPTNVEMVQLVARGAVAEAIRGFERAGSGPLLLVGGVPSEADWLVESELIAALRREGISVRVGELRRAVTGPRPQSKEQKSGPVPAAQMSFPVDTPPRLIEGKPIPYPEQACAKGLEGEVTVRLILNEQGSVANVLVQESTGEPFESAVSAAVEAYRFEAGVLDGEKAPSDMYYRFRFPALETGCGEARSRPESPTDAKEEGEEGEETPAALTAAESAPVGSAGEPALRFQVSELEMRYADVGRKLWVGPKRVDRFARMRLDLRLLEGDTLLWSGTAEHYASDRVPFGALRYLENDQYVFAKPEIAEGSAMRIVEPLVVAGLIGGLVLLFYANQTGN